MSKRDDPQCDRHSLDILVTNQPGSYDKSRAHRSAWVCADSACVLDAMAWVTRGTGEKAWWRVGVAGEWRDANPADHFSGHVEVKP